MDLTGRPVPAWARWLMRPMGWSIGLAAMTIVLFALWQYRRPGGDNPGTQIGLVLLWLVVGTAWLTRLSLRLFVTLDYPRPPGAIPARGRRWLLAPTLFVVWLLLPAGPVRKATFIVSRPGLEQLARETLANPAQLPPARWTGLLRSRAQAIHEGGVHLFTGKGFDGHHCGYAYFPPGTQPPLNETWIDYSHVDGPWYQYTNYQRGQFPPPAQQPPAMKR